MLLKPTRFTPRCRPASPSMGSTPTAGRYFDYTREEVCWQVFVSTTLVYSNVTFLERALAGTSLHCFPWPLHLFRNVNSWCISFVDCSSVCAHLCLICFFFFILSLLAWARANHLRRGRRFFLRIFSERLAAIGKNRPTLMVWHATSCLVIRSTTITFFFVITWHVFPLSCALTYIWIPSFWWCSSFFTLFPLLLPRLKGWCTTPPLTACSNG